MLLELNIKGLCKTNGIEFDDFLADLDADNVFELSVFDLEAICEEYEIDLQRPKKRKRSPKKLPRLSRKEFQ